MHYTAPSGRAVRASCPRPARRPRGVTPGRLPDSRRRSRCRSRMWPWQGGICRICRTLTDLSPYLRLLDNLRNLVAVAHDSGSNRRVISLVRPYIRMTSHKDDFKPRHRDAFVDTGNPLPYPDRSSAKGTPFERRGRKATGLRGHL